MTARDELLLVAARPSDKWQLSLPSTESSLLLGWRLASGPSVDGGVPPEVAQVLAHALTSLGWVSFFVGSVLGRSAADRVSSIKPAGSKERVMAAVAGFPREVHWVSTRRPELAASAFDASFFSWVMQDQAILVSAGDSEPPELDWAQMLFITGGEGTAAKAALADWGAKAVLRPGVDGAVAGFVAADEGTMERALASFRAAAASRTFDLRLLSEAEFEDALAG